ncbi:hypothetical protein Agabi119p4_7933 [Agaricus bisporus var. burnettii]|uniref:Uncharacterized protein n=1 Tax=Agaricus bisporus var. burnettii TaxID=192524 RepID=A0A8H7C973_AGABI|nr:hypothetical protein Agabi119p4_7933 [Agaricus bisporus var. burnettii]
MSGQSGLKRTGRPQGHDCWQKSCSVRPSSREIFTFVMSVRPTQRQTNLPPPTEISRKPYSTCLPILLLFRSRMLGSISLQSSRLRHTHDLE